MLYSVIIDLGFTITEIDYPYKVDNGNIIQFLMDMYGTRKQKVFRDPRLQGFKGKCLAIMRIYPDHCNSDVLFNNGWE